MCVGTIQWDDSTFCPILGEVELELVGWLVQMIDGLDEVPRGASSMLAFSFANFMRQGHCIWQLGDLEAGGVAVIVNSTASPNITAGLWHFGPLSESAAIIRSTLLVFFSYLYAAGVLHLGIRKFAGSLSHFYLF